MGTNYGTEFVAEIKQVSSRKTASLDIVYKLVLETNDPGIMALAALDADVMLAIKAEVVQG